MSGITSVSKARQLYDTLREDILGGYYKQGQQLPSIRQMADQYKLSKNTVNTVYALLANDGLVAIHDGKGTFVGTTPESISMIGVLIFDFSVGMRVDTEILQHIQRNLPPNYFLSLMDTSNRYSTFNDGLERLSAMNASGFLVIPPKEKPSPSELTRAKKLLSNRPTVMINRAIEGLETDLFSMDLGAGIEAAYEYLVSKGRRKIGLVLHDAPKFIEEEYDAYLRCAKMNHHSLEKDFLVEWSQDFSIISNSVQRILGRIDALIAPDDVLMHLSDLFKEHEINIPHDLSLVGINDTIFARMFNPPLTSIEFPVEQIGKNALRRLIKRIEGSEDSPKKIANYTPRLIVRNT